MNTNNKLTRRQFTSRAVAAAASVSIVPRYVIGRGETPPSEVVTKAVIGVGGMGMGHLKGVNPKAKLVAVKLRAWSFASTCGLFEMSITMVGILAKLIFWAKSFVSEADIARLGVPSRAIFPLPSVKNASDGVKPLLLACRARL